MKKGVLFFSLIVITRIGYSQDSTKAIDSVTRFLVDSVEIKKDSLNDIEIDTKEKVLSSLTPAQRLMRTKLLERKAKGIIEYYTCKTHSELIYDEPGYCQVCNEELIKRQITSIEDPQINKRATPRKKPYQKK